MSQAEKMKQRQLEHEQRKKARVDMMHQQEMQMGVQGTADLFLDAEAQKNREIIKQEKIKVERTIQLIKNDQISQKNSIESRIAERKKRLEMKRSVILQHNNSIVETTKDPVKPPVNLKKKYRPQPVSVRHSDLNAKRGFIPLISPEDLDKDAKSGIGSTLDDVEINDTFTSPKNSRANPKNTQSSSPFQQAAAPSHTMGHDMQDLSEIM